MKWIHFLDEKNISFFFHINEDTYVYIYLYVRSSAQNF